VPEKKAGFNPDSLLWRKSSKKRGATSQRRKNMRTFLIFLVTIGLIIAGVYYGYNVMLQPVDPEGSGQEIIISVPEGASAGEIAKLLEDEGLIRSELAFRFYMRQNYGNIPLMAGQYLMDTSMAPQEIITKLKEGEVYRDTRWFVIPEGFDVERMAYYLDNEGLVDGKGFLEKAHSPSTELKEEFPFLSDIPDETKFMLEGYLFPAKYEVESDADAEEIITLMLRRFQRFWTEENLNRAQELDMSVHEVVTLASVVEREAASDQEWEKVASVFHNRLDEEMLLQSCATVQYVLEEQRENLTTEDTRIESIYNTYQVAGLPPGPISSPGEASLNATLNPEDTNYFYFVSRGDGSGQHYFAETYEEHLANRQRADGN